MNSKLRIALICIVAVIFVCCCIGFGHNIYQEYQAQKDYMQSASIVGLPDFDLIHNADSSVSNNSSSAESSSSSDTQDDKNGSQGTPAEDVDLYAQGLAKIDLSGLKRENKDVLGWISIPGTIVSYPLMQGDDNEFYLQYTWKRKWNIAGAIFIDYRSSAAFDDFNTIIYGHRMKNESMFGSLKYYNSEDYLAEHPSVYITTEDGVHRYDIFAAYEADLENTHTYRLGLNTESGKTAYINYCLKNSVIASGIVPTADDTLITLSTCTGDGYDTRWVVHAVLAEITAPNSANSAETN